MNEAPLRNLQANIERTLAQIPGDIAGTLDKALDGQEVSPEEGARLFEAQGPTLLALMSVADELRRRVVGGAVTYIVNRNINFTNVCIKRCGFCAFSRDHRTEEGYFLPEEEIVRRAREAWDLGASEVCVQAGLPPKMDGMLYVHLTEAIKQELPDIHIHGFSPEEVLYGSIRSGLSIEEYLIALKEAGVGSLPGTSAEVLDDELRDRIAPGRITTAAWTEVITTAHRVGLPTTSTIMYGHIETDLQRTRHIALIRDLQKETGGFTEFVPLSLVHAEAPMYAKGLVPGVRPGATGDEVIKMHAIARIMLHGHIDNIQVSWVKEGLKLSQVCLDAGANDLGGTLINESISTAAGASFGQLAPPKELRRFVWDAGRVPVERTTTYGVRRTFTQDQDPIDPLDEVGPEPEQRFGSYFQLVNSDGFRFRQTYTRGEGPPKKSRATRG